MTYAAGEALILTQIQALSSFNTSNSSRGIYSMLNTGAAKSYVILRPGPIVSNEETGGGGRYTTVWVTFCDLSVKLKDYGETLIEVENRREEIINRFRQYTHANNDSAIEKVAVVSAPDIIEVTASSFKYLQQQLRIEWTEVSYVTLQD